MGPGTARHRAFLTSHSNTTSSVSECLLYPRPSPVNHAGRALLLWSLHFGSNIKQPGKVENVRVTGANQ